MNAENPDWYNPVNRPIWVLTTPGWRELAVTPVPEKTNPKINYNWCRNCIRITNIIFCYTITLVSLSPSVEKTPWNLPQSMIATNVLLYRVYVVICWRPPVVTFRHSYKDIGGLKSRCSGKSSSHWQKYLPDNYNLIPEVIYYKAVEMTNGGNDQGSLHPGVQGNIPCGKGRCSHETESVVDKHRWGEGT